MKLTWTNKNAQKRYEVDMKRAAEILNTLCKKAEAFPEQKKHDFRALINRK